MTNVVYGHFDSAGSLHKQIESFAKDDKGFCDDDRFEDWKEGLDDYFQISKSMEDGLDTAQWHEGHYAIKSFVLDKDTELGRSLVRSYLDETPETSFMMLRNIRASLLSMIPAKHEFWDHLYDMALVALVSEQLIHHVCDQAIDICVGGEGWTLGDCVSAFATLSGQYHAKVIETKNLGVSKSAFVEHDFDYMIQTIIQNI